MRKAAWTWAVLLAAFALPAGAVPKAPAPARKTAGLRPGAAGGPTDFSGIWELDDKSSSLPARQLQNSVLEVTQKGARIWIQPVGKTRSRVLAEEVVVDGRTYEKSLGNQKGTLTARWGEDGKSVWLEIVAGTEEDPRAGVQRSVWRLSEDRNVWMRETVTTHQGAAAQSSRAVFHRQDPGKREPTPAATPRRPRLTPPPASRIP